jgi:hypothetical protein
MWYVVRLAVTIRRLSPPDTPGHRVDAIRYPEAMNTLFVNDVVLRGACVVGRPAFQHAAGTTERRCMVSVGTPGEARRAPSEEAVSSS